MVYLISPVGHPVDPVMVKPDTAFELLVEGLEALDLVGEDLLDPEWLEGEGVAEAPRLATVRERYRQLHDTDAVGPALREAGCGDAVVRAVEEFFDYLTDADGRHLSLQQLP
jgi:hypothetical protein